MESLLSAVMSDLLSRALSMLIQRYRGSKAEEAGHKLQRLQRVLLRIDAMVEEAEGRHITNQAMLRQLEMLRHGMYGGHYMLDTLRYRGHGGDGEVSGGHAVALSRFYSTKRLRSFPIGGDTENAQSTMLDAESLKKLDKILGSLDTMIGDMAEFAVFLEGYPRICRQPYSEHLILEKVMFGRQMEKETVINFLLRPEPGGDGNPGVLPVVGAAWTGKSTLVEYVCLDDRVRGHFSLIVFFTGDGLGAGNTADPNPIGSGVIRHQGVPTASPGRSLAVIELSGGMEEETWRRLYGWAASSMGHGSKIILTSRLEKIADLGTAQPLRLKLLTKEAYWYFFKVLAFGSAHPDDQPKLAPLGMEIAAQLNGAFVGANLLSSLLRANQSAPFWRRILQCLRDHTSRYQLMFGEHPRDLVQKGRPVHLWRLARTHQSAVTICRLYQKRAPRRGALPKITARDVLKGHATHQEGRFHMVLWRSSVPPYYAYLASCSSQPQMAAGCSMAGKKRPRQARV